MIKLIVFDWDDVFTQGSIEGYYKCYHEALVGVGVNLPPEIEKARIVEKWGAGHAKQLEYLLEDHPELIPKAIELYQRHSSGDTFVDCLNILPGSQKFLEELAKNYKLAIATGAQPKILKDRLMPKFGIDPSLFTQIVTIYDIDDIVHAKPHPFMLNKIMETQGVLQRETVMVGDAANDMLMARNAGVEPIAVLTGHLSLEQAEELEIKHIIDKVTDLESELNKIEIEQSYRAKGLETEYVVDEAGKVYEPHRHEQTYLYTLSGSVKIKVDDGDWQTLRSGQEFIVGTNQLHEAEVGPEGWEYVAAWNPEEAEKFKQ